MSKLILVAQAGKDLAHSISLTLALLATAESSSEHPLATAITKYAKVNIIIDQAEGISRLFVVLRATLLSLRF